MNTLADLLDLQDVDSQIDRLLHDRSSLPVLAQYRAAHTRATRLETERDRVAGELRETELALDRTSGELDLAETKLASEQNRLYAGGLSARDADYLRREVEMLDRKKSQMEEDVLGLMERREQLAADLATLEGDTNEAVGVRAGLEAEITEAWKGIDADIARKERRKAEIVPGIAPNLITVYESLRRIKTDGVAVGRLADDTCGACHLKLTKSEQLDATRSNPPRCIHCNAILVV